MKDKTRETAVWGDIKNMFRLLVVPVFSLFIYNAFKIDSMLFCVFLLFIF